MNYVIQKAEPYKKNAIVFLQTDCILPPKNRIGINRVIIHSIVMLFLICSHVSAEGLSYGRFLIETEVLLEEEFSDNVFAESRAEKSDNSTTVSPALSSYMALTDSSRFGVHYEGDFSFYSKYDDLNKKDNQESVDWSLTMPAGSTFLAKASILDTAIQPDSEDDSEDPYMMKTVIADANLKPGEYTDIGFHYEYKTREFDDEMEDARDDYKRNAFTVDYVNRYFPRFPFLLEYRYAINDRNDKLIVGRDSISNAVYVGARWTPETRLSGNLRLGYQKTDYEGIPDVDSFVVDTALDYRLTEMTTLHLVVNRTLKDSTTVENESGNNYTFTTWEGSIRYRYSDPLQAWLRLRYEDKEYDKTVIRNDDIYNARIGVNYQFNRWMECTLSYQFAQKDSTATLEEYRINSGYFGVKLSL